jgi:hypothetical protein
VGGDRFIERCSHTVHGLSGASGPARVPTGTGADYVRQDETRPVDFVPMSESWVNAVIEIRIPLDVAVNAPSRDKLDAAAETMDQIRMPDNAAASCRWEVVEDGEPIAS